MGTIKSECVNAKTYRDREQAALEIFEYMECFYYPDRTGIPTSEEAAA